MALSSDEKEYLVIDLLNKNYTIREIAKSAHVSFSYIGNMRKKLAGKVINENEEGAKSLSVQSQAFRLFLENKLLVDVAILLDIPSEEVLKIYSNYLTLQNMRSVVRILTEHRKDLAPFLKWFNYIQKNSIKAKDVKIAIDNVNKIKFLNQQKEDLEKGIQTIIEERNCLLHNLQDIKSSYY